jgi:hypothetical protein
MKENVINWLMGISFALLYFGSLLLVIRAVVQYLAF